MNKEKVRAEISKYTDFVKKHPAYVFLGVELMHMNSLIAVRKQMVLSKSYSDMQKHYDTYRMDVIKRFGKKKSWPRMRQKRFHQMRVGA